LVMRAVASTRCCRQTWWLCHCCWLSMCLSLPHAERTRANVGRAVLLVLVVLAVFLRA
jgi:hypothetical protein